MRRLLLAAMAALLLTVQGCGNSKDIQSLAYVTAIGLDFKDGKYIAYVQVLNFINIARSDAVELGKPVPIWIGRGDGETISGAIAETNATSQSRLFWGHVKAVVVTEAVMKRGLSGLSSSLLRDRQARYTLLVYGTKERMEDILTQKSIFNLSPLDTMMYTAVQLNTQKAYLLPVYANKAFAYLNEPGAGGMIPEIGIQNRTWHEDYKKKPMFIIRGAFFFDGYKYKNHMAMEPLKGMRWRDEKLDLTPLKLLRNDRPSAVVMLGHPKFAIKTRFEQGKPRFDVSIRTTGFIAEQIQPASIQQLQKEAALAVVKEVQNTYRLAAAEKTDCYRLQLELYRKHPRPFRQLAEAGSFFLDEDSLASVKVKVYIRTTGKFKGSVYSEKQDGKET
ncbi:Ger(x)C family spore germination protein [Paenibacillus albicereus]|uniref:Ger(X)C family spore germination protein n=1 Tax=Paenibacillus albicereus TaxID=2726185 RepID=A0A6H2GXE4_9BACL|nr:Ger(x)C family spore germination protein [Paenibacillus albicereus]QJC52103.1 Ger(x)C family spore germination protein [Paenibacillus albicereus]